MEIMTTAPIKINKKVGQRQTDTLKSSRHCLAKLSLLRNPHNMRLLYHNWFYRAKLSPPDSNNFTSNNFTNSARNAILIEVKYNFRGVV